MSGNSVPLHALSKKQRALVDAVARTATFATMFAGVIDTHTANAVAPCAKVKWNGRLIGLAAYIGIGGASGVGKSPAAEPLMNHRRAVIAAHDTETLAAWQEHRGRMTAWYAEYAGTQRAIGKLASKGLPPNDAFASRLVELEQSRPKAPPSPPRTLERFTFVAVKEQTDQNRAFLIAPDEGSAFLPELGKDLIGLLCSSWSGIPISFSRRGTGITMVDPKITMVVPIQPDRLLAFLRTPQGRHALEIGLFARFLWYFADPSIVEPAPTDLPDVLALAEMQEFLGRCEHYFREQIRLQQVGWEGQKILTFSPRAGRALESADRRIGSIRLERASSSEMASLNKLHEQIIRHAARHHEFEGEEGPITAERVECAEEIALWSYENFSQLINSEEQALSRTDEDADRLHELLFRDLRVRDKIPEDVLRERAFNIGMATQGQFKKALAKLCAQEEVCARDGMVHLNRRDSVGHLLGRGGVR
ncbi:DUF3987 domain-containing protein [Paraburkholderia sp. MPAMCS5]|uniref:DUF3987 domain-containing protein n=1 Tax=Paraburkholderia sp. MPAMCS5 TaxID=3112563 RepID=UPI002E16F248|nr:DUF3987 domain-containing protein [Paraburkholderia sp. MPAMCS5]